MRYLPAAEMAATVAAQNRIRTLIADRDRARDIAVALEQQVAAVAALHVTTMVTLRPGRPPQPRCVTCSTDHPCLTAQALGVAS